jgi:hypothetical protein
MYVLAIGTEVNVYDVQTAGIVHTFQLAKKITCICFSQVKASFYLDIPKVAELGHSTSLYMEKQFVPHKGCVVSSLQIASSCNIGKRSVFIARIM